MHWPPPALTTGSIWVASLPTAISSCDQADSTYSLMGKVAATAFLLELISRLQVRGTVPMIRRQGLCEVARRLGPKTLPATRIICCLMTLHGSSR